MGKKTDKLKVKNAKLARLKVRAAKLTKKIEKLEKKFAERSVRFHKRLDEFRDRLNRAHGKIANAAKPSVPSDKGVAVVETRFEKHQKKLAAKKAKPGRSTKKLAA